MLSIALIRPGYPDGEGNSSTVRFGYGGREDHYTSENLGELIGAIKKLKAKYKPKTTVLVGHSGGAASSAVILGMEPGIADAAVLVACPCDLITWRSGRRPWSRSENPKKWVSWLDSKVKIVALTGSADDNTTPSLASPYIAAAQARGIDANFQELANETHNGAFRAPEVLQHLASLLGLPALPR